MPPSRTAAAPGCGFNLAGVWGQAMVNRSFEVDDDKLTLLIEEGESVRVEFKKSLDGSASERIQETVCAFANDLSGSGDPGIVVVGLTDRGKPSGLAITDKLLRRLTAMRSDGNILPPPSLLVEKRRYRDKDIAVVVVLPSDSPPVSYKGCIHIRSGPRRGTATLQDERILNERRRARDRFVDISAIPGTGPADLNRPQFEGEYLPNAVPPSILEENERSFEQRLAATKMIASVDDDRATLLGLLTVGKCTRDFVPESYIQFLRIPGSDVTNQPVDAAEIDGTIPDIIRGIDEKLRSHNRVKIDFVTADRERRTDTYPLGALQQLTRNAIMHRAYEATNAPVRVTWFDDRIEIQNPGGPFGIVTKDNFGQPGVADYRNPNLSATMKVQGYVQRFGAGIGIARRLLQEAGHPELEFIVESTHVLAVVKARPFFGGLDR